MKTIPREQIVEKWRNATQEERLLIEELFPELYLTQEECLPKYFKDILIESNVDVKLFTLLASSEENKSKDSLVLSVKNFAKRLIIANYINKHNSAVEEYTIKVNKMIDDKYEVYHYCNGITFDSKENIELAVSNYPDLFVKHNLK